MGLSDAELIELGKKALLAKEKEKARSRATNEAILLLLKAHGPEYQGYLEVARKKYGV